MQFTIATCSRTGPAVPLNSGLAAKHFNHICLGSILQISLSSTKRKEKKEKGMFMISIW